MFNNQELLTLMIISYILVTLIFDLDVISPGSREYSTYYSQVDPAVN